MARKLTRPERRFSPIRHIPRYSRLLVRALQTPMLVYFVLAGNLVTFASAGVFTLLEQGENPRVQGYFDGLWWAFATVTTVGYGDVAPVTSAGRLVAMTLMVTGILFFVGFSAVLVSAVDTLANDETQEHAAEETAEAVIHEIRAEMKVLRSELRDLRGSLERRSP